MQKRLSQGNRLPHDKVSRSGQLYWRQRLPFSNTLKLSLHLAPPTGGASFLSALSRRCQITALPASPFSSRLKQKAAPGAAFCLCMPGAETEAGIDGSKGRAKFTKARPALRHKRPRLAPPPLTAAAANAGWAQSWCWLLAILPARRAMRRGARQRLGVPGAKRRAPRLPHPAMKLCDGIKPRG
jgi:hypothetical protein